MRRHRNDVAVGLYSSEQLWVLSVDIEPFEDFWVPDESLEFGDRKLVVLLAGLFGELGTSILFLVGNVWFIIIEDLTLFFLLLLFSIGILELVKYFLEFTIEGVIKMYLGLRLCRVGEALRSEIGFGTGRVGGGFRGGIDLGIGSLERWRVSLEIEFDRNRENYVITTNAILTILSWLFASLLLLFLVDGTPALVFSREFSLARRHGETRRRWSIFKIVF